jgi:hypothetical protein
MEVPTMLVVDAGYAAILAGGMLLLMVAFWWSWAGDGIEVPRERWPAAIRAAAMAGWALFIGGIFVQLVGYVAQVGVARWPGALTH